MFYLALYQVSIATVHMLPVQYRPTMIRRDFETDWRVWLAVELLESPFGRWHPSRRYLRALAYGTFDIYGGDSIFELCPGRRGTVDIRHCRNKVKLIPVPA